MIKILVALCLVFIVWPVMTVAAMFGAAGAVATGVAMAIKDTFK